MNSAFNPRYKCYALLTITAVYLLNLVDRGVMALLLQPIKEDLQLSDTQLGFLTGIAFGLFYAGVGIPLARWADRGNRATLTSLAIGLWGLTVMACLLVTNYAQLAIARIAAAIGESGCKPPTYSLVGDYFPEPAERTRAMAIYLAGNPLSALASFVIGGWLNELYGWRMTFFLIGIPGLILAVLVKLTIIEPRTMVFNDIRYRDSPSSMKALLRTMYRRRSCRHLCIALILLYTMSLGLWPWYAVFMMRYHGMNTGELGLWLGLIFSLGGVAGVLLGGFLAGNRLAGDEGGQMRINAVAMLFVIPFYVGLLTVSHKYEALGLLIPIVIALNFFLGPTYVLMQRLVTDEMRATLMAVVMLLANLIGFGVGPQLVGILSDSLENIVGKQSLRYAMLLVSFLSPWAAYHFWQVARYVASDLTDVGGELAAHGDSVGRARLEPDPLLPSKNL